MHGDTPEEYRNSRCACCERHTIPRGAFGKCPDCYNGKCYRKPDSNMLET